MIFPVGKRSAGGSSDAQGHGKTTSAAGNADANHLFANNVRFLSMVGIIYIHSVSAYVCWVPARSVAENFLLQCCLIQPFKFGTIGFFLIAGFLFGERVDRYSPAQYYLRRLRNVFLPWTIWYALYSALEIGAGILRGRVSAHALHQTSCILRDSLLQSAYWFVPNLLLALAILLMFRRVLNDIRTGLVFLLLSLFYGFNIYGQWVPVQHTRAVFGFVFYLWLGAWAAWHFSAIERGLCRIPSTVIIGLVVLGNALAMGEAGFLFRLHSADPNNSLRISNQVCSVVVVLAIVKMRHAVWPRIVDVRAHTYGLYLTHTVVLALLSATLKRILPHVAPLRIWTSVPGTVLMITAMFVFTYGGCLQLVRALLSHRWLCWSVGLPGYFRTRANVSWPAVRPRAGGPVLDAFHALPGGD